MYHDTTFPPDPSGGRLAQFAQLVGAFEREEIETGVDLLIAMLDARDGDPDLEDSEAGNPHVTAAGRYLYAKVIAQDPPDDGLDNVGDVAWQEWDGREPRARRRAVSEPAGKARASEDDELDDEDSCSAGEDQIDGNTALGYPWFKLEDDDAEPDYTNGEGWDVHTAGVLAQAGYA